MRGLNACKSPELEASWQERLCRRSIPLLLWIALLITPLIYNPFGVNQFRLVKEVFCQIVIALMLACSFILMVERWGRKSNKKELRVVDRWGILGRLRAAITSACNSLSLGPGVIHRPMLFLLLMGVLSTAFSTNRALSLRPFLNLTLFVMLYFIIINHVSHRHVIKFLTVILVTGMINGVYCVIQYLGWDPLFILILGDGKGGRMASSGFIGNPNSVGGYLASVIPLSLSALLVRRPFWMPFVGFVSLIAMGAGIGFNQTFTAAASAALSVPVFFIAVFLGIRMVKKRIVIAIAVAVVLLGIFLATAQPMKARLVLWKSHWSNTNWNVIVSHRPFIWWLTIKMIEDRPLLGRGLGTFTYWEFPYQASLLPQLSPDSPIYPVIFHIFKTPHNEYLLLGAEAGIPGMAAAGWLFISIIILGWRSVRQFRQHRRNGNATSKHHAPSESEMEVIQRDYAVMIGFACTVLVSAVESLTHFYFHIAPSAFLAVTALGLWVVILQKNSREGL
ncbi:MAG: O-antigen ligase family protein [Deltaproteobacteria bacterium]|nr:O-antigen ligase family protein [Deltaproteobacteria bacterium]